MPKPWWQAGAAVMLEEKDLEIPEKLLAPRSSGC